MDADPRVGGKLVADLGSLAGGVVVHDQAQLDSRRGPPVLVELSKLPLALRVAGAVLVFGFGTLAALYAVGNYPPDLPGLYAYTSATWGDGLLLPVLAWALVRASSGLPPPAGRGATCAAAVAGAACGIGVVAIWYADANPHRNWTITAPHAFDLAGEIHAGFLVLASALFAGLWVELARRLRQARGETAAPVRQALQITLRSLTLSLAVGCSLGYGALAAADSVGAAGTTSGRASLVGLGLAAAILLLLGLWALGFTASVAAASVLTGLYLAACVATARLGRHSGVDVVASLAAATAGLALARADGAKPPTMRGSSDEASPAEQVEVLGLPALFIALTLVAGHLGSRLGFVGGLGLAITGGAGAVLIRFARYGSRSLDGRYPVSLGISLSLLATAIFGAWLGEDSGHKVTAGFIVTLMGAILGGIFWPQFRTDYESVPAIEADSNRRDTQNMTLFPSEKLAVRRIWERVGLFTVAAFLSLLVLAIAASGSLGWVAGGAVPYGWRRALAVGLVAVVLLALTVPVVRQANRPPPSTEKGNGDDCLPSYPTSEGSSTERASSPARRWSVADASCCASAVWILLASAWFWHPSQLNWLAVVQAVLLTGFAAECVLGNGLRLHGRWVDAGSAVTAMVVSLALLVVTYLSIATAVKPDGVLAGAFTSFLLWLGATVLIWLLTVAATSTVFARAETIPRTLYSITAAAVQDLFLLTAMSLVLCWFPQLVLAHIPPGSAERWAAIGSVLAGFLLFFGPAFLWTLENNDRHNGRECQVLHRPVPQFARGDSTTWDRLASLTSRVETYVRGERVRRRGTYPDSYLDALSGHTAVQNAAAMLLATLTVVGLVGFLSGASSAVAPLPPPLPLSPPVAGS